MTKWQILQGLSFDFVTNFFFQLFFFFFFFFHTTAICVDYMCVTQSVRKLETKL